MLSVKLSLQAWSRQYRSARKNHPSEPRKFADIRSGSNATILVDLSNRGRNRAKCLRTSEEIQSGSIAQVHKNHESRSYPDLR